MFGYVQYEKSHLYFKDYDLFRAAYCGVCKGIGKSCGQLSRFGLSYDAAFLNVLFHNLKNTDLTIEKQRCVKFFGGKHAIALVDELTEKVACFNTLLLYYKLSDDVSDENKGKIRRFFTSPAFRRVKRSQPELTQIVDRNMRLQSERERLEDCSVDLAADATANMLQEAGRHILGDAATAESDRLLYAIGKWIYVMDAIDDYDKDIKKKTFNPFRSYGCADKASLLAEKREDLRFLFGTLFYEIRECLAGLHFHFNRDLIDNVLLRGLPMMTEKVAFCAGCKGDCGKKGKNKEKKR